MNKIKTIKTLTKLANQLDELGQQDLANFVDLLISKTAGTLTPVGNVWEQNGKFYRKFEDSARGLVTKEVTREGQPVGETQKIPSAVKPLNAPTQPTAPAEEQSWSEFFQQYNPFSGLSSGLQGNVESTKKEQSESEVPWINKADDGEDKKKDDKKKGEDDFVKEYLEELKEVVQNFGELEFESTEDEPTEEELTEEGKTEMIVRPISLEYEPTEELPEEPTELIIRPIALDEPWSDVSMWDQLRPVDNRFPIEEI